MALSSVYLYHTQKYLSGCAVESLAWVLNHNYSSGLIEEQ